MTIGFWRTKSRPNFCVTHAKGLDELQIKMLQELKPEDKLALWVNDEKPGEHRPDYTLEVMAE